MPRVRKTVSIDAAPEQVWAVLGDLTATPEWLPGTVEARMDGATRICVMAEGAGEVREEISDYAPERRSYRYRHVQVPLPVRRSEGTFAVESSGNGGAVVRLDAQFEPLDPEAEAELTPTIDAALGQALDSLRRRVEQGLRWDA